MFALVGALLAVRWWGDRNADRRHTVLVNAPTPIFAGSGRTGRCNRTLLTTAEKGVHFKVRRIRYLDDCATVDVVLKDGREGYFVLGVGDVSVDPPLFTIVK